MESEILIDQIEVRLFTASYPGGGYRVEARIRDYSKVHQISYYMPVNHLESTWDILWRKAGDTLKEAALEHARVAR